ncbi:MAG: HAD family hydrolase [Pseudomonadota bacterium]
MKIKGILFDKDGTLLDYWGSWMPANKKVALHVAGGNAAISEKMLVGAGYDPATDRVASGSLLAAASNREIAEYFHSFVPEQDVEAIYEELSDLFAAHGETGAVPVAGLAEVIAGLKNRNLTLGVATSDSERGAYGSLKDFGILAHMDFVAGYDSGHGRKPGPGMVEGFCGATGLSPVNVAVVGDNLHDMEMGRAAGAGLLVGVLTGTSLEQDLTPHAHHVIDSIADLETLLDRVSII